MKNLLANGLPLSPWSFLGLFPWLRPSWHYAAAGGQRICFSLAQGWLRSSWFALGGSFVHARATSLSQHSYCSWQLPQSSLPAPEHSGCLQTEGSGRL